MPAAPHEHHHTILGIKRTNAASVQWAVILGMLAAVANGVEVALQHNVLRFPPPADAAVPWIVLACDVILVVAAALGVASYHPGMGPAEPHGGPLVPPKDGG